MTWGSFCDYWCMRDMGTEDAIARNYDLARFVGVTGETRLALALRRAGIHIHNKEHALNYIPEVAARLKAMGHPDPDYEKVRVRLITWYDWDRIRKGDLTTWFKSEMRR